MCMCMCICEDGPRMLEEPKHQELNTVRPPQSAMLVPIWLILHPQKHRICYSFTLIFLLIFSRKGPEYLFTFNKSTGPGGGVSHAQNVIDINLKFPLLLPLLSSFFSPPPPSSLPVPSPCFSFLELTLLPQWAPVPQMEMSG